VINFATETLISLSQAAQLIPGRGNRKVSPNTVWRWTRDGCRAPDGTTVKLESLRIGGRFCTSREAVARFVAATTGPVEVPPAAPIRTPAQRNRGSERAARKLAAAGI
jgi:hypothetical protein